MIIILLSIFIPLIGALIGMYINYYYTERTKRIESVVDKYMTSLLYVGGLNGLIKAGISNLKSEKEYKLAISKIIRSGTSNPLGRYYDDIEKYGLKNFFNDCCRHDMNKTSIEDILNKNSNKS